MYRRQLRSNRLSNTTVRLLFWTEFLAVSDSHAWYRMRTPAIVKLYRYCVSSPSDIMWEHCEMCRVTPFRLVRDDTPKPSAHITVNLFRSSLLWTRYLRYLVYSCGEPNLYTATNRWGGPQERENDFGGSGGDTGDWLHSVRDVRAVAKNETHSKLLLLF